MHAWRIFAIKKQRRNQITGIALFLCVLILIFPVHSGAAAQSAAGRMISYKGQVGVVPQPGQAEIVPKAGMDLFARAEVITGRDGWSSILMADETLIQLNRNTRFILKEVDNSAGWFGKKGIVPASARTLGGSVYELNRGEIWLRNKNPNARIGIHTPTVSAGIRGTEVNIRISPDETVTLSVLEGLVEARNKYGGVVAGPGEMIYAQKGRAPVKRMLVSPEDAVQWTLTIPPVDMRYAYPRATHDPARIADEKERLGSLLKQNPGDSRALTGLGWIALEEGDPGTALGLFSRVTRPDELTLLGEALSRTMTGDIDGAEQIVSRGSALYPDDPGFLFHAAQIKLARRDPAGAARLLENLTQRQPGYGPAWSLLSIIKTVLADDRAAALTSAQNGVAAAPGSPAAHLALGYAFQSGFDLENALDAAGKALEIDPDYVPAMVARASYLFASDRTKAAGQLIESAWKKAPENPDVLNLRGFIQLAGRDVDGAVNSFLSALRFDPGMGEPHLGLALAYMRLGDTAGALREMTTAVLLEPRRAVFVSYWAKMLYQIKRFDRALQVLEYAQKLDPLDPTPFLYEAIVLRDLNRPTEAVEAIQKAVQLNDNRAVYRSRFLLDRDMAVKNVSQHIIFQDLGLSDWARSKALASVKTDYLNSAGHTFLAGTLLSMEDRLRSGNSENLLGLMLQQANLNSLNSFQDYTSFFEGPAVNGVVTGTAGNLDTMKGEAIVYGALPEANLAFNSIVDYVETSGWRNTNLSRSKGGGLSLKWDPTPEDGLLLLASVLNSDGRGRQTDPYEYDATARPDNERDPNSVSLTLGYHRRLSPQADLLIMGKHYDYREDALAKDAYWIDQANGIAFFNTAESDLDLVSDQVQAHMLYRTGDHQLIFGGLLQWRERDLVAAALDEYWLYAGGFWFELLTVPVATDNTVHDRYQSWYVQDIWRISPRLTAEMALYYDILENNNVYSAVAQDQERFNPRLGLIFTPTDKDTFRIAGFRYLTPFNLDRLDPTDIAGIPLFRNNYDNTLTKEADFAWEHEWEKAFLSVNTFYLESEVEEKAASGTTSEWSARIKGVEPVLNLMVFEGAGLTFRYRYLDIENEYAQDKDRRDHLAAASFSYLHPSGFFTGISEIYRQEDFTASTRDTENIWITDLFMGYRFPDRRGAIRLDVKNLFDEQFNWVVDDMVFTGRAPAQEIVLSMALYF